MEKKTLKDKFEENFNNTVYINSCFEECVKDAEQFADEHAIGFAEWIAENHYRLVNVVGKFHYWKNEENKIITTDKLLTLYKKETE